ncbi:MAG: O-antigen polymerase [Eubacteriaceae bacterium]
MRYNKIINKFFILIIYILSIFSFIFCLYNIWSIGIENITNNMILRIQLSVLGPFAIILMFPIGLSTYYWICMIEGNRTILIKCKSIFFTFIALVVAFFRGQRTDIVLIIMLPLLYAFDKKRKFSILIICSMWLVLFSSIYSIIFKVNTNYLGLSIFESIKNMLIGDIDRNWSYWMALSQSEIFSNNIMFTPYSGYIYTLFTFIPRGIVSFKGYSTETWFVYFMGNNFVHEWGVAGLSSINWGLTLSGLTEGIINGGYVGIVFYSIIVGYVLKKMEILVIKYRYLTACVPLVAIILSGYTFNNIIVIYLPVIITLMIFNRRDIYNQITIRGCKCE